MNEADRLRAAMRVGERSGHGVLDLDAVLRQGRRLRRRRRLTGAGAAALALAVVVGVPVAVRSAGAPQRPAAPAAQPAAGATGHPSGPTAGPTATAAPTPVATDAAPPEPLGDVVRSGIRYGAEERVFYVVPVDVPHLPGVTIGLMAGRRTADGGLAPDFLVNDVVGDDRRDGFHEIGYDQSGPHPTRPLVPTFGYFVGPAERIVGTVDGRQVAARLVRWSEDPRVVIFWFDPAVLPPGVRLDGIAAHDARGRRL
ncbi:hypothetical protein [Micromonospora globbae]|uniref:hypothetical protein n=1 Tax=Micromonospora globbae TaxID=1894969 RepID=UPI00343A44F1|nr:hypothetical protein OH732_21310 [Micromonospora globbae]